MCNPMCLQAAGLEVKLGSRVSRHTAEPGHSSCHQEVGLHREQWPGAEVQRAVVAVLGRDSPVG